MSRATIRALGGGVHFGANLERAVVKKESAVDRLLAGAAGQLTMRWMRLQRLSDMRFALRVARAAEQLSALEDAAFDDHIAVVRERLRREGPTGDALGAGLAIVADCARRTLGKQPYAVQIAGAMALVQGRVIEMATGEGKSLTATLAAGILASCGIPVDIFTVNEYLAHRDAQDMRPFYQRLGLRVSNIGAQQPLDQRLLAYAANVLYVVNKDYVFDYLRHRSAGRSDPFASRGLFFAIVDEADSILVDEATTPLILAREGEESDFEEMPAVLDLARTLKPSEDFSIDPMERKITLLESAKERVREISGGSDTRIFRSIRILEERTEQALCALHLYRVDRDYVVHENKVQIVDEDTGRLLPDRSWQRGLHQFIELKEGCQITAVRETIGRITYPQFFRRYLQLSGMSGTVAEVCSEVRRNYGAQVIRLPTHRPLRRRMSGPLVFLRSGDRWLEMLRIVRLHLAAGQAVLIGTRSVQASEHVSNLLARQAITHDTLNARDDSAEAAIIARAGVSGSVTVATNMAGRGTDIVIDTQVAAAGGLVVILTEFHESSRVDRQLFGRCARQGDPGEGIAVASLEDELFLKFLPRPLLALARKSALNGKLPGIVARLCIPMAQWRAGRHQQGQRDATLASDDSLREQLGFTGDLV